MKILVKSLPESLYLYNIPLVVDEDDTIDQLRQKIQESELISGEYKLFYDGMELENQLTIFDYLIEPESIIYIQRVTIPNNITAVKQEELYPLLLMGDSNVGKTSILIRYTENKYCSSTVSTLVDFRETNLQFGEQQVKLRIWDNCNSVPGGGFRRDANFLKVRDSSAAGKRGIFIIFDVTDETSFENVKIWVEEIEQYDNEPIVFLVGAKCDLNQSKRIVDFEKAKKYAEENDLKYFEISAKDNLNINQIFEEMAFSIMTQKKLTHIIMEKLKITNDNLPPNIHRKDYLIEINTMFDTLQISINQIPLEVIQRREIREFLEPIYFAFTSSGLLIEQIPTPKYSAQEIKDYVSNVDNLLNILELKIDQISEHSKRSQDILSHLKAINNLRLNLGIKISQIPTTNPFTSNILLQTLESIQTIMQKFDLKIDDIPLNVLNEQEILKYILEIDILFTKLEYQKAVSHIPHNVKQKKQIPMYLQVQDLMLSMNLTNEHIPVVCRSKLEDQHKYLLELKTGKEEVRKSTIMVVGEEGVGKTTFIKHLLGNRWVGNVFEGFDTKNDLINNNEDEKKKFRLLRVQSDSNLIHRYEITDGIDVNQWKPSGKEFIMNIFDFAGQEIYYNTHQFFLSNNSVYLLLFNGSRSINKNRIAHWLHTIFTIAPTSFLFLIATFSEQKKSDEILQENILQLNSIIDNILFLDDEKTLQIILPPNYSKSKEKFWRISLTDPRKGSPANLIQSIIGLVEQKVTIQSQAIPTSWLNFRKSLFPHIQANSDQSLIDIPYSLIRLGIIVGSEFEMYAKKANINDVHPFLQLLNSWGEVVYINNKRKKLFLVVIKPQFLISIFKFIISARKKMFHIISNHYNNSSGLSLTRSLSMKKFKKHLKYQEDDSPHLLRINQLYKKIQEEFPDFSTEEVQNLTISSIIPVLTELRLIFHLKNDLYLIPSMINKRTKNTNELYEQFKYSSKLNNEMIYLERRYDFIYLPSGLFTRLMIEVWQYFAHIQKYSSSLTNEDHFWENGFIIASPQTKNKAIIQLEKSNGISATVVVQITCYKDESGDLLPKIHRSINNIIQSLEFENKTKIYCSAILNNSNNNNNNININHTDNNINNDNYYLYYEHSKCLSAAMNQPINADFPIEILPYLIPEFYNILSQQRSTNPMNENEEIYRYQNEVIEIKELGSGASGIVMKGKWFNQLVAIKKPFSADPFEIASLINEIELLRALHHPNLLRLLDVYTSPFAIITELCSVGDLAHLLRNTPSLHPIIACKILRDISLAISYLHNRTIPIIHCDVRLPNIFIKDISIEGEVCAILGDVGFSRIADQNIKSGKKSTAHDVVGFLRVAHEIRKKLSDQLIPSSPLNDFLYIVPSDDDNNNNNNNNVYNKNNNDNGDNDDGDKDNTVNNNKIDNDNNNNNNDNNDDKKMSDKKYGEYLAKAIIVIEEVEEKFRKGSEFDLKFAAEKIEREILSPFSFDWKSLKKTKINPISDSNDHLCDQIPIIRRINDLTDQLYSLQNECDQISILDECFSILQSEHDRIRSLLLSKVSSHFPFVNNNHNNNNNNYKNNNKNNNIINTRSDNIIYNDNINNNINNNNDNNNNDDNNNKSKGKWIECRKSLGKNDKQLLSKSSINKNYNYNNLNNNDELNNNINLNEQKFNLNNNLNNEIDKENNKKWTKYKRESNDKNDKNKNDSSKSFLQKNDRIYFNIIEKDLNNNQNDNYDQEFELDNLKMKNSWEWSEICRSSYRIIQFAVKEDLFDENYIQKLLDLEFIDHPLGDYDTGMKLHHISSLYSNDVFLSLLLQNNQFEIDVNSPTRLRNKSAIHLVINQPKKKKDQISGIPSSTIQTIQLLFDYGANINIADDKGETPLIKAAMFGWFHIVVTLLNLRADPNLQSKENITAIIAAARMNNENHLLCIKALLQFGSFNSNSIVKSKSELSFIQQQASLLLDDPNSIFGRNRINEEAIRSWLR